MMFFMVFGPSMYSTHVVQHIRCTTWLLATQAISSLLLVGAPQRDDEVTSPGMSPAKRHQAGRVELLGCALALDDSLPHTATKDARVTARTEKNPNA
jgi:hypothetical protein